MNEGRRVQIPGVPGVMATDYGDDAPIWFTEAIGEGVLPGGQKVTVDRTLGGGQIHFHTSAEDGPRRHVTVDLQDLLGAVAKYWGLRPDEDDDGPEDLAQE